MLLVESAEYCILVNVGSAVEVEVHSTDGVAKEDLFKARNEI